MLIAAASLPGQRGLFDVRCVGGFIASMQPHQRGNIARADIHAHGGALLPGLHDHHIHVCALAARQHSVPCGPDAVRTAGELAVKLRGAPGSGWVRALDYHESVAGELDRYRLDSLLAQRPLRLQHRSGKLWMLNSLALSQLGLQPGEYPEGMQLDASGQPTGRMFRLDAWLAARLAARGERVAPDVGSVSRQLAAQGITGVTDASATNDGSALALFEAAARAGQWRLRLRMMGGDSLPLPEHPLLERGERKILLDEDNLPDWESLAATIRDAHRQHRGVALHCVTEAELVFALAVLGEVGVLAGDRIEHASLVPEAVLPLLRESSVRVVTQPGFVRERGERYLADVAPAQHAELYRLRSLLECGIPLAGSSDAPYTNPDPWAAMRAAVQRRTRAGTLLGPRERLSPEQALALFCSGAAAPGVVQRTVAPNAPADLCLLDRPWPAARERLLCSDVRATLVAGECIYLRDAVQRSKRHAADLA